MPVKKHSRGRFITLEGIEGVGKTTNMRFLAGLVERAGFDVESTREPGGTELAERIRNIVLDETAEPVTEMAELLMMFAARSQHLVNLIRPALSRGCWVICDRFTDATRAYQGSGRGVARERIESLAEWVQEGLEPDLTLLLDAPPAITDGRRRHRVDADRFEIERRGFFDRVRQGYLNLAEQHPQRIVRIDAARPLSEVQQDIARIVGDKFFSSL